jgi:hypothetical protein
MPLLDHFREPLAGRRHWEAFHSQWASCIASALNAELPSDYFAEAQVHAGPRIEIDVATWNLPDSGGIATLTQSPPVLVAADLTVPATFPAEFGVCVYETSGGPILVGAIELVSPANKDPPHNRHLFAVKCGACLQRGVGLIVVDIVTNRHGSPFADLLRLMYPGEPIPKHEPLTSVSYRPTRLNGVDSIEIRHRSLAVGASLPVLPLALGGRGTMQVDFEATYEEAREQCRL